MQTTYPSRTISEAFLPRRAITTVALMIGFALLTALAAQLRFHIPGTPVPITGQTFAVLISGAALGARAGAGSQVIYWLMGAMGLPVFAQASGGWAAATGATFGYLVGFVVAAGVVGYLAEHGRDRSIRTALPSFLVGNAIIYAFGLPWLMHAVPSITSVGAAIAAGLTPFVIGDIIKVGLAGLALPTAWKLTARD